MPDRPIVLTDHEVRAVLDGSMTQIRRPADQWAKVELFPGDRLHAPRLTLEVVEVDIEGDEWVCTFPRIDE